MIIRAVDVKRLSELLKVRLEAGYNWTVLEWNASNDKFQLVDCFYDKDIAEKFCRDKDDNGTHVKLMETDPLQDWLKRIADWDKFELDVDYYDLNPTSYDVTRVLTLNPDQNPLLIPDGKVFTDTILYHFESKTQGERLRELDPIEKNFWQLRYQLDRQGFDSRFFLPLEASIKRGAKSHTESYFEHRNPGLIKYDHLFLKDSQGKYSLDKITGTLYYRTEIDHATIKGFDTEHLEHEMRSVNWKVNGYKFYKANEQTFRELCKDEVGGQIMVQLFNDSLAIYHMEKPDYLLEVEDKLKMYPKMEFPGGSTTDEIQDTLQQMKLIRESLKLYAIPELEDESYQKIFIERLASRDDFSVLSPSGPREGEEVLVSWNDAVNKLAFQFLNAPWGTAREFFVRGHDPIREEIEDTLHQYPFRQLAYESSKDRLVEGVMEGKRMPVHLEVEIIPIDYIDKYAIVEVTLSRGASLLTMCGTFDGAFYEMNKLGEDFRYNESKQNSEIAMIGVYTGQEIHFEPNSLPTTDTGYVVGTAIGFNPDTDFKVKLDDINRPKVIVTQVFVERDKVSGQIVFSNMEGKTIEIDKNLWQLAKKPVMEKKGKEQSLIPKLRINNDKGKKI